MNNAITDLKQYEHKSIDALKKEYEQIVDDIVEKLTQKNTDKLGISETTRAEVLQKLEACKDDIKSEIDNLTENSKDTGKRISILIDFANRISELYLKATLEEKRLILNTITESIIYDEETNKIKVKLRPVFEHFRQIKLQKKQEFSANVQTLTGSLENGSSSVKQAFKISILT